MTWNYDYYADGHIHHAYDVANNLFDRSYSFDHAARLTESYSGTEARGGTTTDGPYRESFSYDAWSNQLGRSGRWWQRTLPGSGVYSYTNNRQAGLGYDSAGNVVTDNLGNHVFDARGARVLVTSGTIGGGQTGHALQAAEEDASTFDGNGQPTKLAVTTRTETLIGDGPQTYVAEGTTQTYYLRSSVMSGYVIDEMNPQGVRTKGYVYAGGERLAEYEPTPWSNSITWQHKNPMTGSWIETSAPSAVASRVEMDPMGRDVGTAAPQILNQPGSAPLTRSPVYLENMGGQTSEGELGMQLYEDFYINKNYGGGAGPGQGGFWDQWNKHAAQREYELMAGGHFLFGFDRMNVNSAVGVSEYEEVYDSYATDVKDSAERGGVGGSATIVGISYYRLIPGSGSPQKPQVGADRWRLVSRSLVRQR
jgi:hypothetical protein